MERIIKFNAWDSYQNKMYDWNQILEMDKKGYLTLSNFLNGFCNHILPLQYTTKNDIYGKEIFEGNILKSAGIVVWNDKELKWSCIDIEWNNDKIWHDMLYLTTPLEIIGNKFENPELLNKK